MPKNLILENLNQPEILEKEYRSSPHEFELQLKEAIEQNGDSETLKIWQARLFYPLSNLPQKISISLLLILCLITGIIAKIPSFLPIDSEWYNTRFIALIVISSVIAYFLQTKTHSLKIKKIVLAGLLASFLYAALLPDNSHSASITMALFHLPILPLTLLALSFLSDNWKCVRSRLNFILYVGEMGIYSVLILLGGMVLTSVTLSLFSVIGLSIERWYMEYIVVWGLVTAPLIATFLFDSIQNRQSKFAPILSNVFSPLFLITVLAYLAATLYQGKSPFTDREFLIIINVLLLVILIVTIFSLSGKKRSDQPNSIDYINLALVSVTLVVNIVALAAILFRWAEHGMTVNRIVVTGINILIFIHLALILRQYISYIKSGTGVEKLETAITMYLPTYTAWSFVVSFVIPLVFKFK